MYSFLASDSGVARVGLGPPGRVFPSLQFSEKESSRKEMFRKSRNPAQMGDLMLVGFESDLPCHTKDYLWLQERPPRHTYTNHRFSWLVGI